MTGTSTKHPLSRREFIEFASAGTLSLYVGITRRGGIATVLGSAHAEPQGFAPNQWIRIDQDSRTRIRAHKSEMGQGVRTALPAIVAAELGADWSKVDVTQAEPGPEFPDMGTSGSGSVSGSWRSLRSAAAAAREVLILAAANHWHVSPDDCDARDSVVIHRDSGKHLTFGALVEEAAGLPVPGDPRLRPDAELSFPTTRLRRVDAPAIVRGRATYGIDVRVPGMKFAVIARPPTAGATPRSWNEAAARHVSGVDNIVRTPSGLAVVARNTWAAIQGRTVLNVQWDGLASDALTSASFVNRLEAELSGGRIARRDGDIDVAMSGAATRLDAVYRAPFQAHAALEPLTCVADVHANRCEIWVGTQRPNQVHQAAMDMLGLAADAVAVHVTLIGGAFGRRIAIDHAREAIELSRLVAAPVQVVWTREDDFAHDMYQAAQVNRMTAALDDAGNIVGWRHQVADYHLSMFGPFDPAFDPVKAGDPWGGIDSPYAFPAFACTLALLEAPVPTGAWRSVTYPAAVFARECFLDEVAHATRRDPVELRLALIPSPGSIRTRGGMRANGDRLRNVLRLAAERAEWGRPLAARTDGRRAGRGIACNPYDREAMVAQVADVSVGGGGDIRVHRVVTAIDVGRVIDRSGLEAQVEGGVGWALSAALKTEITFANGRAAQRNYDGFPVLRMREMAAQEIVVVESGLGPFGAGEPPVPAVFAAVGNAVFAATGQRLRETPLRLRPAEPSDG
jgi:isoquinoline 1-oxidoreductase subunit beta